jgi:hypothetical protein
MIQSSPDDENLRLKVLFFRTGLGNGSNLFRR